MLINPPTMNNVPPEFRNVTYDQGPRPGQYYCYFKIRRRDLGLNIRLIGAPGTATYAQSYPQALAKAEGYKPAPTDPTSIASVIKVYRTSTGFTKLASATQTSYDICLNFWRSHFGKYLITDIDRAFTMNFKAKFRAIPRQTDFRLTIMRILCNLAVDMEILPRNPLLGIKKSQQTLDVRAFKAWSSEDISMVLKYSPDHINLAIRLAAATALQHGDLKKLGWTNYQGGIIQLKTAKHWKEVFIPLPQSLRTRLDACDRKSIFILTDHLGRPWRDKGLSKAVARVAKKAGLPNRTMHGLRKTAICELASTGATIPQIQAITGQSAKTVELYYQGGIMKNLATEAASRQDKLSKHH